MSAQHPEPRESKIITPTELLKEKISKPIRKTKLCNIQSKEVRKTVVSHQKQCTRDDQRIV